MVPYCGSMPGIHWWLTRWLSIIARLTSAHDRGPCWRFAHKVACDSAALADADYDALRPHGFDDEDIWDIAAIAAFFALSNRMANFTGMRPNDEFYTLGREQRQPRP